MKKYHFLFLFLLQPIFSLAMGEEDHWGDAPSEILPLNVIQQWENPRVLSSQELVRITVFTTIQEMKESGIFDLDEDSLRDIGGVPGTVASQENDGWSYMKIFDFRTKK